VENERHTIDQQAEICMNFVIKELCSIFPAWRNAIKNQTELDSVKKTWVKAFIDSDLYDMRKVQFGIRKARLSGSDFFPSVGRFIQWCSPCAEDLGLPPVELAFAMYGDYRYAETRKQLPTVVQAAFNQIQHWDLTHLSEQALFPIFEKHYQSLINRVVNGEDITELCPRALPKPEQRTKTQSELAQERKNALNTIANLRASYFGGRAHG
jgi:hypothetical protein